MLGEFELAKQCATRLIVTDYVPMMQGTFSEKTVDEGLRHYLTSCSVNDRIRFSHVTLPTRIVQHQCWEILSPPASPS